MAEEKSGWPYDREGPAPVPRETFELCPVHSIPAYVGVNGWVHAATGGLCIGPDPARDARVAKRRAEEARRAGRALSDLLKINAPDQDGGHAEDCPVRHV